MTVTAFYTTEATKTRRNMTTFNRTVARPKSSPPNTSAAYPSAAPFKTSATGTTSQTRKNMLSNKSQAKNKGSKGSA